VRAADAAAKREPHRSESPCTGDELLEGAACEPHAPSGEELHTGAAFFFRRGMLDGRGQGCRCLNLSTSMGGTHSKVEGGDRHDLEPEGLREDTRHKIYTGSGSRSSYPTSCLG
jgi:hypothetical protein